MESFISKFGVNANGSFRRGVGLALLIALLVSGVLLGGAEALANDVNRGRITGSVVDAETGEPLVGVNVFLKGTQIGAATDLDGNFDIKKVPPGEYTLVVSMVGYAKKQLTGLRVSVDEPVNLDIPLESEVIMGEEVVVAAKMLRNTGAALLKERQKAVAISDAISAEDFSRAGLGDAAEAMSHVTGVTTVEGKYVFVRGLGDRYTTAQLNGVEIPSADPERRAAQLDLFPTNLLDNIVTVKTATPDKPGNYTGGAVNIATKAFPESFTMSFSSSYGYNTEATFNDRFLTYPGGDTDWLGFDDGTRDIPDLLADPNVEIPNVGEAFTDAEKAQLLDQLSKSFNPVMHPATKEGPVNQSYGFSVGGQTSLFGRPLGAVGTVNYSRSVSAYSNGVSGRWQLTSDLDVVDALNNDFLLKDTRGKDEVLWGGLLNLSYKPHNNHELGFNVMVNQGGESTARFQAGTFPRDLTGNHTYETRVLRYVERRLRSVQGRGEHYFGKLGGLRLTWNGAFIDSEQDEPDLRYFTSNFVVRERRGQLDTLYAIRPSIYPVPTRYFRNLDESNKILNVDLTLPFRQWRGLEAKLKFGGSLLRKERTFRERRFEFRQDAIQYDGDPDSFFSPENVGMLEEASSEQFFRFGNYVLDATQPSSNYDGDEQVLAVYGMVDVPLFRRLRFIGGVRYEITDIEVASIDTTLPRGNLDNKDLLPSFNVVYQLQEDMNLRFAYGRTLARPTFRELAPYASFDFVGDYIFVGNPALKRTLINNYDVRWEWFSRPGEILAVSGFYKHFTNPIEPVINPRAAAANPEFQYRNVGSGIVYGAEFEIRQGLDRLHSMLSHFTFGANMTIVHSEVEIAEDELELIRALDPNASSERRLFGQSPYVVNLDLSYVHRGLGTSVTLHYNIFGSRLSEVSIGGTPDVYEQPRGMLNLNVSQDIRPGLEFKFAAENLLNADFEKAHTLKGEKFPVQRNALGRTYKVGLSYRVQ